MSFKGMVLDYGVSVSINTATNIPDGYGDATATTASATVKAILWQAGSGSPFAGYRFTPIGTHVLAFDPADYTWTGKESTITYNSQTFNVKGFYNNVLELGEVAVVNLDQVGL